MSFTAISWEQDESRRALGEHHPCTVRIDAARGMNGIRYAVRHGHWCMDAHGEWEYEPIPSSRTDEWLERFRFKTWEDAAKAIERHAANGLGRFQGQENARKG